MELNEGPWFTCHNCQCRKPVQTSGGTGYATTDGGLLCYQCCAIGDALTMAATGKVVLYFTRTKNGDNSISNWSGTLKFLPGAVRVGRHNMARVQRTVYFGAFGELWSGRVVGDNSELMRCRRLVVR